MEDERPALRALSIGEIFDRAVTMYVRNFAAFTLIVLTLLVPVGVLQYFYADKSSDSFAQLLRQIQHPGSGPAYDPSQIAALLGIALLVLFLAPFTNNAVAVGVAAIYAGRKPSYREGFARVFSRWGPLVGTSVLSMLLLIGTYLVLVIGLAILAVIAVALTRGIPILEISFALGGIVLLIAIVVFFVLIVLSCVFALYATTIETRGSADAIGEGFRRIFNRREFPKAVLIALAYLALELGMLLLSGTIGALVGYFVHNAAVQAALIQVGLGTVLSAMFTAFITVLVAIYYYDVRTRAEGLDLEVALERLTA